MPSNDPTTLDFVSSVETYRRPVYLNSGNGEVEERYGYSIASVVSFVSVTIDACSHHPWLVAVHQRVSRKHNTHECKSNN